MLSLRETQGRFAEAVFGVGINAPGPNVRADGVSPAARIGFYRTNVFANYRSALALSYPAVQSLVGERFFAVLCDDYIRRIPSRSSDVGQHAERFAQFLSGYAGVRSLPYLADVARLEWCIEESFNAGDHAPLDLKRLAAIAPEHYASLRFLLAPHCHLLSSIFPIDRIWQLSQPDFATDDNAALEPGRVDLLIKRDRHSVAVEALSAAEFAMLTALSSGYTFARALDDARAVHLAFDPADFLQRRVFCGVIVDFAVAAEALAP
ncbi:MAG: DNA-binding domain-containing protein [Betaproteobacteria bacterium]